MGDLERLRQIGSAKISERTHIRSDVVNAILNKEFDKIHAVKARGFIAILEREFGIDLDEWLTEFAAFKQETTDSKPKGYFVVASHKENRFRPAAKTLLGLIAAVAVLAAALYMINFDDGSAAPASSVTEQAVPVFDPNATVADKNETNVTRAAEANVSKAAAAAAETNRSEANVSAASAPLSVIRSQRRLWMSMLDLKTGRYEERTVQGDFPLPTGKSLLILTGHGQFRITGTNGEVAPGGRTPCRLLIKDGAIRQLGRTEYNELKSSLGSDGNVPTPAKP